VKAVCTHAAMEDEPVKDEENGAAEEKPYEEKIK
jgi:hypothetical protein